MPSSRSTGWAAFGSSRVSCELVIHGSGCGSVYLLASVLRTSTPRFLLDSPLWWLFFLRNTGASSRDRGSGSQAIALALFLPNIIWQIRHHFPTIEDLANVRREGKNVILGPLAFVKEQIIDMHPILLPVWLAGLVWFLRDLRWRVLGLTFAVFFVLMEVAHAKDYYLFPVYPMI